MTAVKQLEAFIERFCTPLRKGARPLACDADLKRHIMDNVKVLAADGASKERRAVFLAARDVFPNMLLVIRDPAHAIRIASKALFTDDVFAAVWRE